LCQTFRAFGPLKKEWDKFDNIKVSHLVKMGWS